MVQKKSAQIGEVLLAVIALREVFLFTSLHFAELEYHLFDCIVVLLRFISPSQVRPTLS